MAAPDNRIARIVQQYTVDGQPHVCKIGVRNATVVGSSYNINTRATDSNDLDWKDAADGLAESISYLMGSATTVGSALLEKKVGVTWQLVGTHTTSFAHQTGTYGPASQWTMTLRDRNFFHVKVQLMEPAVGVPFKTIGVYPTVSGWRSCQLQFTKDFTVTNAPWNWMIGLDDIYLQDDPVIAATATLNRKLRRARGVA